MEVEMEQAVEAIFENGNFKIIDPSVLTLIEGQRVKLLVEESSLESSGSPELAARISEELSKEEIVERGKEIYERDVRPRVEAENKGRVVAIDVLTEEFELADNALNSASQLRARLPEAAIFVTRVGYPAVHKTRLRAVSTRR
jgi:predicted DNA-binding antitoxin AbrB/MazE fold protein